MTHAICRSRLTADTRLSVDVFYKNGPLDGEAGGTVSAAGAAVAVDCRSWFVRIAWDPRVNFTPDNVVRLAVGARF